MIRAFAPLVVAAWLSSVAPGMAATPAEILKQKRVVGDVGPGADPLKAALLAEVQKVVRAGRLAPFRTLYGEGGLRYHWREPWQMVYTLALTLPHLPPELRGRVEAYLKDEIAARPPWQSRLLGPDGFKRQADDLPEAVFRRMPGRTETCTAFFPYALWIYADRTGDWQTIRDHWPAIQTNGAAKLAGRANFETLSGAIGMYRLARGVGDTAGAARAEEAAMKAMADCGRFEAVRAAANEAYTGKESWGRGTRGVLYALFHLTPEVARFIASSDELKREAAVYAAAGRKDWPLWWMAQAPVGDSGYYAEGCCAGPEQRGMLFGYEAWIARTPASKLATYVDVPDALVGDCTYLQNLVTAIEAYGTEKWSP